MMWGLEGIARSNEVVVSIRKTPCTDDVSTFCLFRLTPRLLNYFFEWDDLRQLVFLFFVGQINMPIAPLMSDLK